MHNTMPPPPSPSPPPPGAFALSHRPPLSPSRPQADERSAEKGAVKEADEGEAGDEGEEGERDAAIATVRNTLLQGFVASPPDPPALPPPPPASPGAAKECRAYDYDSHIFEDLVKYDEGEEKEEGE